MKLILAAALLGLFCVAAQAQTLVPTWSVVLTGSGYKVRTGPDGSVYTVTASTPPYQVSVDKYAPSGTHLWRQTYTHGPWVLTPVDLAIDSTGAAVVVTNDAGPSSRITTEKLSSSGAILWSQDLVAPTGSTYVPFSARIGASDHIFIAAYKPGAGSAGSGTTVFIDYPSTGGQVQRFKRGPTCPPSTPLSQWLCHAQTPTSP